jgi:hypothetical protein
VVDTVTDAAPDSVAVADSLADLVDAQIELEFSGRCSHSCSPKFMHIELHIQREI